MKYNFRSIPRNSIQNRAQIQTTEQNVKFTHIFTNTESETKSIRFVIYAESKVVNKDSVPIYKLENIQGIKLKNDPYIYLISHIISQIF